MPLPQSKEFFFKFKKKILTHKNLEIQYLSYLRWKRHKTKPMHPSSPKAFPQYQAHYWGMHGPGDLKVTNKQNKTNKTNSLS